MEFYDLNRLYDPNLDSSSLCKTIDQYLYVLIPLSISFGCGVSIINLIGLSCSKPNNKSPKRFLKIQLIFNFLFQLLSSAILISNHYEIYLINSYFSNYKIKYLNTKLLFNFFYNVLLYSLIWLIVIDVFNNHLVCIVKYHLVANYIKQVRKRFHELKIQYNQFLKYQQQQQQQKQSSGKHAHNLLLTSTLNDGLVSVTSSFISSSNPNLSVDDSFEQNPGGIEIDSPTADDYQPTYSLNEENWSNNTIENCESTTIHKSVIVVFIVSFLLTLPQLFAHEIKQNHLSISPSSPPASLLNALNENGPSIYFINEDIESVPIRRKRNKYAYSNNMAQALAITIKFNQNKQAKKTLEEMRKTHSRFFTMAAYFSLASRSYDLCNTIRNTQPFAHRQHRLLRSVQQQTRLDSELRETTTSPAFDLRLVNLTLSCIRKSNMENYLAYNTLYFWFEHTMVIAVPVCILLVIIIAQIYLCLNISNLIMQLERIRRKSLELRVKMSTNGDMSNKASHPRLIHFKSNQTNETEVETSELHMTRGLNGRFRAEKSDYDKRLHRKLKYDQSMIILLTIDIALYFLLSLPYTLMRLWLDLFLKHNVKFNLDFFILFKCSLLIFHVYLIIKPTLVLLFDTKFRTFLAKTFAFKKSYCYKTNKQPHRSNANERRIHFTYEECSDPDDKIPCFYLISCCLCRKYLKANEWDAYADKKAAAAATGKMDYADGFDLRSIEFDSTQHQYMRPSNPEQDLT